MPRSGGIRKRGGGGGKGRGGLFKALTIGEDVRMAVNLKLKDFRNNDEEKGATIDPRNRRNAKPSL